MDPISAIGVVGSVVGIVSLGIELARILQGQIDQISTAKDRLEQFVFEIKATALALTDLQDLLLSTRSPKDRLFNDNGYDKINLVVDRCTIVYRNVAVLISKAGAASLANVDDFVDNVDKKRNRDVKLEFELSKADHLLWPFRLAKVEQYVADLERLKVHLILMLNVAALAKKKLIMAGDDDVTTGYESDEETLLVDQVYYTNEDVDRADLKYEEFLLPQYPGKDKSHGGPDLVFGSNSLAANDLIDNWPHRSEGGGIPSPAEIRQLGVIIKGFTLDQTLGSTRWSPVPVSVLAMQRVAIQNFKEGIGLKSPWDDFTRLPYAYRRAIAVLLKDWDSMVDMNDGEDGSHYVPFRYPQPKILSMETNLDRKTTFSTVLKSLNFFHRRVPKIPRTPQLRVILGCAPMSYNGSNTSRNFDSDAYSSDEEYFDRRNAPRRARYAPREEAGFDPEFVEYGEAPVDTFRNRRRDSEMNDRGSYERHETVDSDLHSNGRGLRSHRVPSHLRSRTHRYDEDEIIIHSRGPSPPRSRTHRDDEDIVFRRRASSPQRSRTRWYDEEDIIIRRDTAERREPRPVRETSRDRILEVVVEGPDPERNWTNTEQQFSERQKQRWREREEEEERERSRDRPRERSWERSRDRPRERSWERSRDRPRDRPRERYYEDSYEYVRPFDRRSSIHPMSSSSRKRSSNSENGFWNQNPEFIYRDHRLLLPSRTSSSITTNKYALAPRRRSFAQPPPRKESYSSRHSHQPLRLTNRIESLNSRREPQYQNLSYNDDGYRRVHSTFETVNPEDQVPPSKESKIEVAQNLLRLWTTVFDIIDKKVRDRILDQGTVSHHQSHPTITPFPQRPGAGPAGVDPTTLNSTEESPNSLSRYGDILEEQNRDRNRNRTARPYKRVSYQLPPSNLSHDESAPRSVPPRSATVEESSEHNRDDELGEPKSEDEPGSEEETRNQR